MICDRIFQGSALREVVGLAQGTAGSEIQGKTRLHKQNKETRQSFLSLEKGGLRWSLSFVNHRQFSANSTGNSPKRTDGHPVAKTPKSRNTFPGFWLFFKEYGASLVASSAYLGFGLCVETATHSPVKAMQSTL